MCSVESDKATVEVPAPVAGVLAEIRKKKGETAAIGEVIAIIEDNGVAAPPAPAAAAPAADDKK